MFSCSLFFFIVKQLEKNPANPKSLFKRLYSLALHPNVFKRLGAAIVFNNIYAVFRFAISVFISLFRICDNLGESHCKQFFSSFFVCLHYTIYMLCLIIQENT